MERKQLPPKKSSGRGHVPKDTIWFAAGPLLAALLAVSLALSRTPARPASSAAPQAVQAAPSSQVVDPVVHNIGKYLASHQILWPELNRPRAALLGRHRTAQAPRPYR